MKQPEIRHPSTDPSDVRRAVNDLIVRDRRRNILASRTVRVTDTADGVQLEVDVKKSGAISPTVEIFNALIIQVDGDSLRCRRLYIYEDSSWDVGDDVFNVEMPQFIRRSGWENRTVNGVSYTLSTWALDGNGNVAQNRIASGILERLTPPYVPTLTYVTGITTSGVGNNSSALSPLSVIKVADVSTFNNDSRADAISYEDLNLDGRQFIRDSSSQVIRVSIDTIGNGYLGGFRLDANGSVIGSRLYVLEPPSLTVAQSVGGGTIQGVTYAPTGLGITPPYTVGSIIYAAALSNPQTVGGFLCNYVDMNIDARRLELPWQQARIDITNGLETKAYYFIVRGSAALPGRLVIPAPAAGVFG